MDTREEARDRDTPKRPAPIAFVTALWRSALGKLWEVLSSEGRHKRRVLAFLEAAPDPMLVVDPSGTIIDLNEPAASLMGYARSELVGDRTDTLLPAHQRTAGAERRARFFAGANQSGPRARHEIVGLRSDGVEIPLEITIAPLLGHRAPLLMVAIRDQSERGAAERRFRELLESAPTAMVIIDSQGQIVLVNAQVEALFGYRRAELIGERVEMLVPEQFRASHPQHIQEFFEQPDARKLGGSRDLSGRRKDGSEFPVEISLSPIHTESGLWVASAIRDLTARRETEASLRTLAQSLEQRVQERTQELEKRAVELARSNAELEEFAYVVSHDLKSPLRGVSSLAEWLHADYLELLDDVGKEHLELLRARMQWMHQLIDAVLDYSRATRTVQLQLIDSGDVVRGMVAVLDPPSSVVIRIDECMPVVRHDATQLARVFQNLIGNALDHAASGGAIWVSALRSADGYEFRVRDAGPGIAEEHRERIFRMFQTLGGSRTSTGMGLAIVKKIVETHGGRVGVRAAPERGAEFFFTVAAD